MMAAVAIWWRTVLALLLAALVVARPFVGGPLSALELILLPVAGFIVGWAFAAELRAARYSGAFDGVRP